MAIIKKEKQKVTSVGGPLVKNPPACQKKKKRKNPPANARNKGLIPGLERFHVP